MKWVVEAGSSTPDHPLYLANENHVTAWTALIELAEKFDSEEDAQRHAAHRRLVGPRFRSIKR
jgi:hypothetical protein